MRFGEGFLEIRGCWVESVRRSWDRLASEKPEVCWKLRPDSKVVPQCTFVHIQCIDTSV